MHTPTFTHAGGIVLRFPDPSEPLILVVRPSRWVPDGSLPEKAGEWLLPKGHVEPGETAVEAGVREVAEEAKVGASNPRFVGHVSYSLPHEEVACAFYLMDEEGPVPSEEDRPVEWLTMAELEEAMPYGTTLDLVKKAIAMDPRSEPESANPGATLGAITPLFVTSDLRRAIEWYQGIGFEVRLQAPEHDPFFGIIARDGVQVMLKEVGDGVGALPNRERHGWARWDAFVFVDDVDGFALELQGRGVALLSALQDWPDDGLRGLELQDPDGYVLFFGRPA